MDPASEMELRLTAFANLVVDFDPEMIESITSIYTGDHDKGKLHFGSKLVIRTKQGG